MKARKIAAGITAVLLALFLASCNDGIAFYTAEELTGKDIPEELVARWYTSQSGADNGSGNRIWEFTSDNKATTPDTGDILFDVSVTGDLISLTGVISLSGKMKYNISGTELIILESSSLVFKKGTYYKRAI